MLSMILRPDLLGAFSHRNPTPAVAAAINSAPAMITLAMPGAVAVAITNPTATPMATMISPPISRQRPPRVRCQPQNASAAPPMISGSTKMLAMIMVTSRSPWCGLAPSANSTASTSPMVSTRPIPDQTKLLANSLPR